MSRVGEARRSLAHASQSVRFAYSTEGSVAQELLQLFSRGPFSRVGGIVTFKFASNVIKVFAEIRHVFFRHRFRSAIAALLRHPGVIAHTVQTHPEISSAPMATVSAARQARQSPFPATLEAMSSHETGCYQSWTPAQPSVRATTLGGPRGLNSRKCPAEPGPAADAAFGGAGYGSGQENLSKIFRADPSRAASFLAPPGAFNPLARAATRPTAETPSCRHQNQEDS